MMARKNWGDARAEMLALMPEINRLISVDIKHVKIYEMMQASHKSASDTSKPLRTGIPPRGIT